MNSALPARRVLVLGGYGVFGGKLCAALSQTAGFEVLVAGRALDKAARFCADHGGAPLQLDRASPTLAAEIFACAPDIVIDAAGPFQAYQQDGAPYALVRAVIAAKADYIDLSDDAAFSAGIRQLDAEARAAGVAVISGASSVPGLSSAAVTELARGLRSIARIETAILPGNRAPRGLSVMRAILAQVGQKIPVTRGAQSTEVIGWAGGKRERLSLPGTAEISRNAAYIGAPDLQLFPQHFGAPTVLFRAGLELPLLHHGLWLLGLPVRAGVLRSLEPLAPLLRRIAQLFEPFGSDRGGMKVRVCGRNEAGQHEERSWTLIAGAGDGPEIPTLPARALCHKALAGKLAPGARPCLAEVTLDEILATAKGLSLQSGKASQPLEPVFRTALADRFDALPAQVRQLHDTVDAAVWQGEARVDTGRSVLARVLCRVIGFPAASPSVPLRVEIQREGDHEIWTRHFADKRFHSVLKPHGSPGSGQVTERFGLLRFQIDLSAAPQGLGFPVSRGWCLGLPLPGFLLPRSDTAEFEEDGRFCFDVTVGMPLAGVIVRYRGWLRPL
ncbi:SDR family oxidoreductase [Phaeobacter sp. HF9A]|uniref:SDR family oxidoreductase n=1 Tax=Phaeobacter sp. HF9A TaxID=2721561 RepID=UPI001C37A8AF|nr:SDR family oxidoreductase [Phaeobacter sp. HF9A]